MHHPGSEPLAPVEPSDETAALADTLTATSRETLSQSHRAARKRGHYLREFLPTQGARVQSLVGELDPTCHSSEFTSCN